MTEPNTTDEAKTLTPVRVAPALHPDEKRVGAEEKHIDGPHARAATPLKENEKPDQLTEKVDQAEDRQEALLDGGLEETFPGSDPVSVKRIT